MGERGEAEAAEERAEGVVERRGGGEEGGEGRVGEDGREVGRDGRGEVGEGGEEPAGCAPGGWDAVGAGALDRLGRRGGFGVGRGAGADGIEADDGGDEGEEAAEEAVGGVFGGGWGRVRGQEIGYGLDEIRQRGDEAVCDAEGWAGSTNGKRTLPAGVGKQLYQRHQTVTCRAHSLEAMDAIVPDRVTNAFHAAQQASTMAVYVGKTRFNR